MRPKQFGTLIGIVLMLALLLSACAPPAAQVEPAPQPAAEQPPVEEPAAEVPAAAEPVTITWAFWGSPEEKVSHEIVANAFMAEHPAAGAAGPKLVRLDGSLDKACRRSFPTPESSLWHMAKFDKLFPQSERFGKYDLTYLDPDVVTKVDAIVGAFMLVRREAIVQAGLLDERFFMYGEDLDWAKRITDAGWEVWYNPRVVVTHIKEAASRHSYRARVEFYRALTLFYEKHYQATTPFWMDRMIRGGIGAFGNVDLLGRRLRGVR